MDDSDGGETAAGATEALSMHGSFGTMAGAAMLGFEQALRRNPPAEVLAAEHMPERGYSGDDSEGLVIIIPESPGHLEPPDGD